MKKIVRNNQTLKDLSMYLYGSINQFYKMIIDNNFTINEIPEIGSEIEMDDEFGNDKIKKSYARDKIIPSTKKFINETDWILKTGFWDDSGKWMDTENWID